MDLGNTLVLAASVGTVTGSAALMVTRRLRRSRADTRAFEESLARRLDTPRSLHPIIDPDICIGSLSCLKACPEGDILGIVGGSAMLVHAEHCIGHGQCAAECPVGAITLVFGTAQRGVDLPEVNEFFESSRRGVHVVGELGGMGLVKNAMRQGLECMEYLAATLKDGQASGEVTDVVVVGSGPAGLAAALGAREAGLSCRVLEQGSLGGTVAHYPRHKVAMTETVDLPVYGRFGKKRISKKELLENFERMVAKAHLQVEEGVKVVGLEGQDLAFELLTESKLGPGRVKARKVVLAIGRRGTPRRLGVPGEELEKVTYSLTDPEQYRGQRVLVVGGGDAALESALALVEEGRARVTLSYRGEALSRARAENRTKVEALAAAGRLSLALSSEVLEVLPQAVRLKVKGSEVRLENDYVIANVGGELPVDLLAKMGVGMRRYFGEALGSPKAEAEGRERYLQAGLKRERVRRRFEHRLSLAFFLIGLAIIAFLAYHGRAYYPLSQRARMASPLHRALRSAGVWGHGVGIAATAFMLSNFLYAARKRLRFMSSWGHIRTWLHFHVFVGFMSPLVIAFHAAFQSNNLLASGTAASLGVVVLTGIVGRYVYGLVPAHGERAEEMEDLQARFVRLRDEVEPLLARAKDPARLRRLFDRVTAPVEGRSLPLMLLALPFRQLRVRADLVGVRRLFEIRQTFQGFRDAYLRMERLRIQMGFYRSLKRLLGGWRIFHASLAIFLVFVIAAHIGLSLYLGYGLFHR